MLGLFKKGKGDANISLDWDRYRSDKKRLLGLLEEDLKIVEKERKSLIESVRSLKSARKTDKKHFATIKKRLDLVHSRLLFADKLSGEETKLQPAETITLKSLIETVDKIKDLLEEKGVRLKI